MCPFKQGLKHINYFSFFIVFFGWERGILSSFFLILGKMKHIETDLQKACVLWFRYSFPQYSQLFFHIPNGGKRNIIEAKKFKDLGVVAGVPDLFLCVARHGYNGFFIEMKAQKGRLSENQKEIIEKLRKENYKVSIINNLDLFIYEISNYLKNK